MNGLCQNYRCLDEGKLYKYFIAPGIFVKLCKRCRNARLYNLFVSNRPAFLREGVQ